MNYFIFIEVFQLSPSGVELKDLAGDGEAPQRTIAIAGQRGPKQISPR